MTLPGVSQLETSPDIFRLLLDGVTAEQTQWKPAEDRWSIAEVLEHLSHVEGHYFRAAVDRLMEAQDAELEPYDQNAYSAQGLYSGRDAEDSFAHFEEQREHNIVSLNHLKLTDADRAAKHPELGSVTLDNILNEWAFHDLGHIRQIAELVRALRYHPRMGALQSVYTIRP